MENESLEQAEKAEEDANRLVRAQEVEVARTRLAGVSVARAEGLLSAYREGARLALERWRFLQTDNSGS